MTAKEFNKELKSIVSKFDGVKKSDRYMYEVDTILGAWSFSAEYSPRIKVAKIHSRFNGPEYSGEVFAELISDYDKPSSISKKWNHYSSDPIYILDFLEETLNNFQYLQQTAIK